MHVHSSISIFTLLIVKTSNLYGNYLFLLYNLYYWHALHLYNTDLYELLLREKLLVENNNYPYTTSYYIHIANLLRRYNISS